MTKTVQYIFYFCLFIYSSSIFANPQPSLWRFEFLYGKINNHYQETQDSVLFTNRDIKQSTDKYEFTTQYNMIPTLLDVAFTYNYVGNAEDQEVLLTDRFKFSTLTAGIGLRVPFNSDFVTLRLVGEYFKSDVIVDKNAFGFRNLTGTQFYPEIEFFPFGPGSFFQITPYAKVPLISSDDSREEVTYGLKLKIPYGRNRMRYPLYAYQKALIIKFYSTRQNLLFQKEGFIPANIEYKETGVTVGINW